MTPEEKTELAKALIYLAIAVDYEVPENRLKVYLLELDEYPIHILTATVYELVRTETFFPSIGQILNAAGLHASDQMELEAMEQWGYFLKAKKKMNELAVQTLNLIAPSGQIHDFERQEEFKRKEFIKTYLRLKKSQKSVPAISHQRAVELLTNTNAMRGYDAQSH